MSTRKNEILALARSLFAERGYTATSMRDLAEASGVLPGSLYAHFKSKSDLARQIVMDFFTEVIPAQQAVCEGPGSGVERFAEMIDTVFEICARHHEAVRILHYDWKELSALDDLEEMRTSTDRTLDLWHDAVADGVEDGSIAPDIDAEYMVRLVSSAIVVMLDQSRFQMRATPTSAMLAAGHLKRLLLGAVTPSGAAALSKRLTPPAPEKPARRAAKPTKKPAKRPAKKSAPKRAVAEPAKAAAPAKRARVTKRS